MPITKRQVAAIFAAYSVVRGTLDEIKPTDDLSSASEAFDKVAFDACMTAIDNKILNEKGGK